jgi:hypothetical protein
MSHANLALVAGFVLVAGTGCQAPEKETRSAVVQQAVDETLDQRAEARVIINLVRSPDELRDFERRAELHRAQLNVRQRAGSGFRVIRQFNHVPAIVGMLSREALENLRRLDDVQYVQLDELGGGSLAEAVPSTGADKVRTSRGLRGKGVRVAVLDSGASTTHPAIADSLVAQHCFTSAGCPPNDTDEGTSAEDDEDHGSNVTGIITSNGTGGLSYGYAPDSEIIAVKVLDRDGRGWVSDWVSGLEWVYDNLATNKVRLINMSLDTDSMYQSASACDLAQPAFVSVAADLNAAGVTIFASSGNAGSTDSMSAPACNTGFISVGATYDAQLGKQPNSATTYQALFGSPWPSCADATTSTTTVTCFTNTGGTRLDLLAPGAILTSAGNGTTNTNYRGTSQASPAAAGVAALMLECNPSLTPARISEILKSTGQSVRDTRTGRDYPLIRAEAAVAQACGSANTGGAAATGGTTSASSATGGHSSGGFGTGGSGQASGGFGTGGSGGMTSAPRSNTGGQSSTALGGQTNVGGSGLGLGGATGGQSSSVTATTSALTGGAQASGGSVGSAGGEDPRSTDADRSDVHTSCSCRTVGKGGSSIAAGWLALLFLVPSLWRSSRARRGCVSSPQLG